MKRVWWLAAFLVGCGAAAGGDLGLVDPAADLAVDPAADLALDPAADLAVDPAADLAVGPAADLAGHDLATSPADLSVVRPPDGGLSDGVHIIDFASTTHPTSRTYYAIYLPAGYATSTKTYPWMMFFMGSGEIGVDPAKLSANGPFRTIKDHGGVAPTGYGMDDMIFVAPNQPVANGTNTDIPLANEVFAQVTANFRVDATRFYTSGLSMGGNGAHSFNIAYPARVAASLVLSAANMRVTTTQACALYSSQIPLWMVHGSVDTPGYGISPTNTKWLYDTINACTPAPTHPPRYSLVSGYGHSGVMWNDVYANLGVGKWTLLTPGLDTLDGTGFRSAYEWLKQFHR